MNKLTKRLAAIGAAMTMAVSMMSMGASAYTSEQAWGVRYYPTAPTSVNVTSQDLHFSSNGTISSFYENCTTATNSSNSYGQVSYVTYKGYKLYNSGYKSAVSSTYYRYNKDTNFKYVKLSSSITNNYQLVVTHDLHGNGVSASFSGYVRG